MKTISSIEDIMEDQQSLDIIACIKDAEQCAQDMSNMISMFDVRLCRSAPSDANKCTACDFIQLA